MESPNDLMTKGTHSYDFQIPEG